jgi:hypothetical protein
MTPSSAIRFAVVAVAALVSVSSADVPFQQLADFGMGGAPYDVDPSGRIVGAVRVDGDQPYVPVIWDSPTASPVVLPNVDGGYAYAINSSGDIVGNEFQVSGVYGTAVLWVNGTERVLLPDLGEGAYATDINESGVIIGNVISNGNYLAARWVNRKLEVLAVPEFETPDGIVWTLANSINSSGVITGTVRGMAGSGTPSAAVRWDVDGAVSIVPSEGEETKGVSINNEGAVLINGYFGSPSRRAPALVQPDGSVGVLAVPADDPIGATALTMSRNGIAAGYYYSNIDGNFVIKGVAWLDGVFTPLAMPEGQRYAFPSGVGNNGLVFGSATDGVTGRSVPGFWALPVEDGQVQPFTASGAPGQAVELSAVSRRGDAPNVGHSVAVAVEGAMVGRSITDAQGRARMSFTIPPSFQGTQMTVRYTDENGATAIGTVSVTPGCAAADLNCNGTVGGDDLGALLSSWGTAGPGDLNGDGRVTGVDLGLLLAAWG